jgi:hypothetical protein
MGILICAVAGLCAGMIFQCAVGSAILLLQRIFGRRFDGDGVEIL